MTLFFYKFWSVSSIENELVPNDYVDYDGDLNKMVLL